MLIKYNNYLQDITIQVINKCNLKCLYCFSSVEKEEKIQYADFIKIIDFVTLNGVKHVKITGGEPFLHEDIYDFLNYIIDKKCMITIFTNLTIQIDCKKLNKYDNICIVVNTNNHEKETDEYKNQIKNLYILNKLGCSIVLGKNIEDIHFDFTRLLDFACQFSLKKIRLGIANRCINKNNKYVSFFGYEGICSRIVSLIKEYKSHGFKFFIDCAIPLCSIRAEDRDFLMKNAGLKGWCPPRIIIDTALHLSHCYVTHKIENRQIDFFSCKNINDLKELVIQEYNSLNEHVPLLKKCKSCSFYKIAICSTGCYSTRYEYVKYKQIE